uniref:N/A n=1 Tax=Ganoderma boninense TaxID=34458 RepID=A0A5K1K7I9_9APHY|nr:N/A [Ganoderma boninense]
MASSIHTPDTPPKLGREPSYIHFTPRRAMASFENLVVLANYEEHLREARRVVWRDRGEKPVELQDLGECVEHACRGGIRASLSSSFSSVAVARGPIVVRDGHWDRVWGGRMYHDAVGLTQVSFILLLTRIRRIPKRFRLSLIRHALFGEDSVRFAATLGSFVALYKFILNALPLVLPQPEPKESTSQIERSLFQQSLKRNADDSANEDELEEVELGIPERTRLPRQARLSVNAQAHQIWIRKRTRWWYSAFAGSLAGALAILFEKRSRRVGIAQRCLFGRYLSSGLQGSFNAMSDKHGFKIPHGDVLVFTLCCGQIMYAFLMRPDTLPPSYNRWIQVASKVPEEAVRVNKTLVREGWFKPSDLERVLDYQCITTANHAILADRVAKARLPEGLRSYGNPVVPCSAVHPDIDSCFAVQVLHFWEVFRWMLPIYGALHFIPMMLFRRDKLMRKPAHMLLRAAWGTGRSSAFLGVFVVIYQAFFCAKHNLFENLVLAKAPGARSFLAVVARRLPPGWAEILVSKQSFFLGGLLSGLSLFVEEKRRREELAMYVLPKGLESAWVMARGKGWVFGLGQYGEALLTAMGMGMVMLTTRLSHLQSTYQNDPQHLSGLVRRILYQFVGPN